MKFNIFDYADSNYILSKSYLKNDMAFDTTKCRKEPSLFSKLVYDYVFSSINEIDLF